MVENPAASSFWKQDFVKKMESETPDDRTWRDIVINYCRVGGRYLKPIRFRTTAPPTVTAHMEGLLCDHEFKHPRCVGQDAEGESCTKVTASYMHNLIMILVMVACVLLGAMGSQSWGQ